MSDTATDSPPPYLSVVLPVYQEHDAVEDVVSEVFDVLGDSEYSFELITVDDGSTDGTADVLQATAERLGDRMRIVTHPYNKGNGSAVKSGIRSARGEVVACMDSDGQHDPKDLLRMIAYMDQFDLVVGARTSEYKGPWHRKLGNAFYNSLASWLTRFKIEDLTSGCRMFRASAVRRYLHLFPARFSYPTTTTMAFIKGGHNVKYVPIQARTRRGGDSKISLGRDGSGFVAIMIKMIVLFEPLRIFLPVAIVFFVLGITSSAYGVWSAGRLVIPNSAAVLFVVGVLVVLLGLISEQIATLEVSERGPTD